MTEQKLSDIVTPDLESGAIYNDEFTGFHEDYLILHCLIRKYKPQTFMEVGTNCGTGTNIICNANPEMKVFSLDLPKELCHISLQSPEMEGKGDRVGQNCKYPYTQIRDNSLTYDFKKHYPLEGWFIDGEHTYQACMIDTWNAIRSKPNLIVWHDADIPDVYRAITEAFKKEKKYDLFRVIDTRIAYALRK